MKNSKAKMFLLPAALLLLAAACNNSYQSTGSNQGQNPPPAQPASQPQVYKYQPAGFEFQYPAIFQFTQPQYANLENKIVQVGPPRTEYPGTNFNDAGFAVSDQFTSSLAACIALPATALELQQPFSAANKQTINGITFYTAKGDGAGAGNLYESRAYRTWHNKDCIEITETLHTGNIGNYDPGTVKEVDHNDVFNRLDQALNSFKFN